MVGGLFMLSVLCGCENGFLDAKPNKAILVPTALEHYQALLDNARDVMNSTPYLGEVSADDFYMAENTFESYVEEDQNAHVASIPNVLYPIGIYLTNRSFMPMWS